MSGFNSLFAERLFNKSLSLVIPTNVSNSEFEELFAQSIAIDKIRQQLTKSQITFEDYLDAVEFFGVDINRYCEEVEANLEHGLNDLYF